jgi:hypothetical protein
MHRPETRRPELVSIPGETEVWIWRFGPAAITEVEKFGELALFAL